MAAKVAAVDKTAVVPVEEDKHAVTQVTFDEDYSSDDPLEGLHSATNSSDSDYMRSYIQYDAAKNFFEKVAALLPA